MPVDDDPTSTLMTGIRRSQSPEPLNASSHSRFNSSSRTSSPTTSTQPTTPRAYPQPTKPATPKPTSPPKKLLSTYLVEHPDQPVSKAISKQFPYPNALFRLLRRFHLKSNVISGLSDRDIEFWEAEGPELRRKAGWKLEGEQGDGVVVSDMFWKMYLSIMPTLKTDPLSGLVPPDLIGSTTTLPLTIISLIPDIMRHYHDVIIRARKEVFLATNYWQPSNSVNTISQSLRDLSALVIKENRPKVVVKVIYDRGSWEQLWNSHAPVGPADWTPLDLPAKSDIPGLELEVINFHRVLLGTFHAKFLIVDRKVALINSNNIQDRPNLELMAHLEGPVVDAFYEVALHSWYNKLDPPLPCLGTPYEPPKDAEGNTQYLFQDHNPFFDDVEILKAARAARLLLRRQTKDLDAYRLHHEEHGLAVFKDAVQKVVDRQRQNFAEWKPGEEINARAHIAMHELREFRDRFAMGIQSGSGSRSGSRAPSRRTSMIDVPGLGSAFTDKETAAITAMNAAATVPTDPSEAPSSPTVVGDSLASPKKHCAVDLEAPVDSPDRGRKGHVLFRDTNTVDSSGKLMDRDTAVSATGGGRLPSALSKRPRAASPRAERIAWPASPLSQTPPDSSVGATFSDPLEVPESHGTNGPRSPAAVTPGHPVEDKAATDSGGDPLPLTARMPEEIPSMVQSPPANASEKTTDQSRPLPELLQSIALAESDPPRPSLESPPEHAGSRRMFQLSKKFNAAGVLSEAWATVEDSDQLDSFRPHVVHSPHDPVPVAMCCRKPHGFPGHHDIRNPQNAAWLAGFRYAKEKVFIQTPTLNARPIVRAVKQACRRGVQVTLLLDLGFNDKGESIPFQGGTNEEVVDKLYKKLGKEGKSKYLQVYWYTGKDQVRPLNAVKKQRNCHIKFAAYDGQVVIIGNGNQDSQSWFHSQEVNVMIDSRKITAEMMDTLVSNQNTMEYGAVDADGVWRDKDGKTLEDHGLTEKGGWRGLSGFIAFAKTI